MSWYGVWYVVKESNRGVHTEQVDDMLWDLAGKPSPWGHFFRCLAHIIQVESSWSPHYISTLKFMLTAILTSGH